MNQIIELTETQTRDFRDYWSERNSENWGLWPPSNEWPDVGVSYTATQIQQGKRSYVHIKFDREVHLGPVIDRCHDIR